jgi:hypothetical protein
MRASPCLSGCPILAVSARVGLQVCATPHRSNPRKVFSGSQLRLLCSNAGFRQAAVRPDHEPRQSTTPNKSPDVGAPPSACRVGLCQTLKQAVASCKPFRGSELQTPGRNVGFRHGTLRPDHEPCRSTTPNKSPDVGAPPSVCRVGLFQTLKQAVASCKPFRGSEQSPRGNLSFSSGHGFSRAAHAQKSMRLQPLRNLLQVFRGSELQLRHNAWIIISAGSRQICHPRINRYAFLFASRPAAQMGNQ